MLAEGGSGHHLFGSFSGEGGSDAASDNPASDDQVLLATGANRQGFDGKVSQIVYRRLRDLSGESRIFQKRLFVTESFDRIEA